MTLSIGRVGVWTGALDAHPTAVAQNAARRLEELGYPTLWIPEAVGRDPFVASANLLAATSTLKLATGIANIYARDPMAMASGVASSDGSDGLEHEALQEELHHVRALPADLALRG